MSGIYVHVPFCKSKCTYCDFASYPKEIGKADAYFACLYREMKGRSESLKNKTFDTVYFGGGTPSFVDPKYIYGAMKQLRNFYNIAKDAEITLELNPGTVTEEKHATYKLCGVNRYSVGLQSADDELLKELNRIHTAEDFIDTTRILNGENFSADVMLGLPSQTKESVKRTIDLCFECGAKHISAYALKAEEGTPMYGRYLSGELPSEDETAELYDFARARLEELSYKRYEVSNFAMDGYRSNHNMNYWRRGEYIGFGVSASSFIDERRFTNTEKIDEYVACIMRGKVAEIFSENIEGDEREFEYLMLALRTEDGFSVEDFNKKFGVDFYKKYAYKLKNIEKYTIRDGGRFKIKPEYLFVQNEIIINLMD